MVIDQIINLSNLENVNNDAEVNVSHSNSSTFQNPMPDDNNDVSNETQYSLGGMCFRYFLHALILSILVNFVIQFLAVFIMGIVLPILKVIDSSIISGLFMIVVYGGLMFLGYYLLSRWSLHDCFLKGRTISKKNEKTFLLFITVVYPIILLVISYLFSETGGLITLDYVASIVAGLATFLNRKRIKTN